MLTFVPVMHQRPQESFRVCKRHGSLERREEGTETCRMRVSVGLKVDRRAAIGSGRGQG